MVLVNFIHFGNIYELDLFTNLYIYIKKLLGYNHLNE